MYGGADAGPVDILNGCPGVGEQAAQGVADTGQAGHDRVEQLRTQAGPVHVGQALPDGVDDLRQPRDQLWDGLNQARGQFDHHLYRHRDKLGQGRGQAVHQAHDDGDRSFQQFGGVFDQEISHAGDDLNGQRSDRRGVRCDSVHHALQQAHSGRQQRVDEAGQHGGHDVDHLADGVGKYAFVLLHQRAQFGDAFHQGGGHALANGLDVGRLEAVGQGFRHGVYHRGGLPGHGLRSRQQFALNGALRALHGVV